MDYVFLDLEFNQSYSPPPNTRVGVNEDCPFEIIQIGAVKTDENIRIIDTFSTFVKPQLYLTMHPHVAALTGITIEQLIDAPDFCNAYHSFMEFFGSDTSSLLFVWGKDDLPVLHRNIVFYKMDEKLFSTHYVNVQKHASAFLKMEDNHNVGLRSAIDALGLHSDIKYHDALNDALYTAKIYGVVKPDTLLPVHFSAPLPPKKEGRVAKKNESAVYTSRLYRRLERILGRPLSKSEKRVAKLSYSYGQEKLYD